MIVVIVRHMVRPDRYEAAKARLIGNRERMMLQPGIVFRYTGESADNEIVTLTGWRTRADREAWDAARKAAPPKGAPSDFYTGIDMQEIEVFDACFNGEPADCPRFAATDAEKDITT